MLALTDRPGRVGFRWFYGLTSCWKRSEQDSKIGEHRECSYLYILETVKPVVVLRGFVPMRRSDISQWKWDFACLVLDLGGVERLEANATHLSDQHR